MRPQTAMAAVFLVMIGTSMLLLRAKSARLASSEVVTVTERGTPAPAVPAEPPPSSAPAFAAPPPPLASVAMSNLKRKDKAGSLGGVERAPSSESSGATGAAKEDSTGPSSFATAMASYRAGRFEEARRGFDLTAGHDPAAALWSARSVREAQGCAAAVGRFDRAARQGRQTPPGWDALLEGAQCYRQLGETSAARSRLTSLLGVDSHKDRARAELARLDADSPSGADLSAARASKARASESPAANAAAAAPAVPPASPPAAAAPAPAGAASETSP
jgi:hypothetical protein